MSIETMPPPSVTDGLVVAIEVEVRGRWEALALFELLQPFHAFLVQHSGDDWVVHASAPGHRGEPLTQALQAVDRWGAERDLDPDIRVGTQQREGDDFFQATRGGRRTSRRRDSNP